MGIRSNDPGILSFSRCGLCFGNYCSRGCDCEEDSGGEKVLELHSCALAGAMLREHNMNVRLTERDNNV